MTTQELRIGNYVLLNTNHSDSEVFQMEAVDIYKLYESDCYDISPIPLTPEVLEACGFEREPFISALYQNFIRNGSGDYDGYCLSLRYPNYPVYLSCGTKFNFLHQLQNIYYALTSQELQIDIDKLKNAVK